MTKNQFLALKEGSIVNAVNPLRSRGRMSVRRRMGTTYVELDNFCLYMAWELEVVK